MSTVLYAGLYGVTSSAIRNVTTISSTYLIKRARAEELIKKARAGESMKMELAEEFIKKARAIKYKKGVHHMMRGY